MKRSSLNSFDSRFLMQDCSAQAWVQDRSHTIQHSRTASSSESWQPHSFFKYLNIEVLHSAQCFAFCTILAMRNGVLTAAMCRWTVNGWKKSSSSFNISLFMAAQRKELLWNTDRIGEWPKWERLTWNEFLLNGIRSWAEFKDWLLEKKDL